MFLLFFFACQPSLPESQQSKNEREANVDAPTSQAIETGILDTGEAVEGWRSVLYPVDWQPGFAVGEHFLHDFSFAGYRNGELEPTVDSQLDSFSVVDYGADSSGQEDSTFAMQSAIDAAVAAGGGVIQLDAGEYRIDGLIEVQHSGIVLQGEGPEQTFMYFTKDDAMTDVHHVQFVGSVVQEMEYLLEVDGASLATTIEVAESSALSVGMEVSIGWVITDAFVAEHGMTDVWQAFNGRWRSFFRRTITAIDGQTIHLDVPLRYPAKVRDGASMRVESGYLSDCGIENLSISSVGDWHAAWEHDRSHVIALQQVKDCFVRNVHSYESPNSTDERGMHLQSGGVLVVDSKRVSVIDSSMQFPQNRGPGGNGYLFEVSRSSEVLFQDCLGRAGRHNFIQNWDFGNSGTVFLRTTSEGGSALTSRTGVSVLGNSEFHHSLSMANLIDHSHTTDGWKAANRLTYSSGAGHSATETVFWNITGNNALLTSYQYGHGYVIGTEGLLVISQVTGFYDSTGTEPDDYTEGLEEAADLQPQSLYEDQLVNRLLRGGGLW